MIPGLSIMEIIVVGLFPMWVENSPISDLGESQDSDGVETWIYGSVSSLVLLLGAEQRN